MSRGLRLILDGAFEDQVYSWLTVVSFINKKYFNDETTMAGAGIKGFSTTGEMYMITFVLLAPVQKSDQPMKITLTSPRDRPIDTSGRFCKECGTKSPNDIDKNCHVCGSTLPVATR